MAVARKVPPIPTIHTIMNISTKGWTLMRTWINVEVPVRSILPTMMGRKEFLYDMLRWTEKEA